MELTREFKQTLMSKICAPVEKVEKENGEYHIFNRDTGRSLSKVSKRYVLIPNEKVFPPFIKHFGYENLKEISQYGNGKYTYAKFNTGRSFNLGTNESPDIINEQLVIQNSYNKTKAFSFMHGAFRHVCANGLYSGEAIIAFRKKHVGDIPVDDMIQQVFDNYQFNNFDLWRKFRDTPLSIDDQKMLINDFSAYEIKNYEANSFFRDWNSNKQINHRIQSAALKYITEPVNINNQRNAWGLYNQLNRAIKRTIWEKDQISKVILGNKTAENYLKGKLSLN